MNKEWEMVIGLEVHVELSTKSKIFCSCTTEFGGEPNTHCCPVCMGMPGTLPVLNKKVLESAISAGLALNCEIEREPRFDRKNYFYPDLPKAYQISQLYKPIAHDGYVEILVNDNVKKIRIHEMHMEEDAGKLIHSDFDNETYPDYNRCGVPLLEIVSEPDFRSAEEVSAYLDKIRALFTYLEISDCKMQEGSMRADVNLSVRRKGEKTLGTRTEMKNINSIKAIERAIENEADRQVDLLLSGERVVQETRHWNDDKRFSYAMRSKENAQDYRYFPEPDIPPMIVTDEMVGDIRNNLPEFMEAKKERFMKQYGLSEYDAGLLVLNKKQAEFFEVVVSEGVEAKAIANWLIGYFSRSLRENNLEFEDLDISPVELSKLITYVEEGKVNRKEGLEILDNIIKGCGPEDVEKYIKDNDLFVSTDNSELEAEIDNVLSNNQKVVDEYKSGKEKVIGFLVGQVMKNGKGKFNPSNVKTIMEKKLKGEV
ncbi:MAG: Asp-tRNA(Asn)/Glu-tRNA(Gln) amidotransferase subunit GatB [Lachnospiraceae bacterium]|nr:Asp-tRNA(Asn)/Glu-tRNA(Gln) amidotransferase subunit GatB [Lachnospiraceae bacterium]